MKKVSLILALGLAVMLTGCGEKAKEAIKDTPVQTEAAANQDSIDVFGEVQVDTTKEIFIDFPCQVEKVYVNEGQKIKKGDKILSLDLNDYKITIQQKENEIALYEDKLKELRQNINPLTGEVSQIKNELSLKKGYIESGADPDITALKRSLDILEKDITSAKKEYEANKEIFAIGGISVKELDDSKKVLESREKEKKDTLTSIEKAKTDRQLEVNRLAASLKNNEAQLTNTDKQNATGILDLESKLKTAKMDLKAMKNKLNKSYIKDKDIVADSDNMIVYDITCNEGTVLGKGESAVFKMMDGNTLFVSVDIPEEFSSKAEIGSEAVISPAADKEATIKGKIIRIAERAVKQNGETIVKADVAVEEKNSILKPGLTVDVQILNKK